MGIVIASKRNLQQIGISENGWFWTKSWDRSFTFESKAAAILWMKTTSLKDYTFEVSYVVVGNNPDQFPCLVKEVPQCYIKSNQPRQPVPQFLKLIPTTTKSADNKPVMDYRWTYSESDATRMDHAQAKLLAATLDSAEIMTDALTLES